MDWKTGRFSQKLEKLVSPVFDKLLGESDFFKKWFTNFGTGLPVNRYYLPVSVDFNHCWPTSLPVSIPAYLSYRSVNQSTNRFTDSWLLKFEIWIRSGFWPVLPVFTITGHTGGERFLRPYRFFNPWACLIVAIATLAVPSPNISTSWSLILESSFLYVLLKSLNHMFIGFYWKAHIITIFRWAIQCDILLRIPYKTLIYMINYLHEPTNICIDNKWWECFSSTICFRTSIWKAEIWTHFNNNTQFPAYQPTSES
jgi:hypothetical protein